MHARLLPKRIADGKASLEVVHCAIVVAVGFDHKPSDNLDLLSIPQRVDHHHIGRYEARASTGCCLAQPCLMAT
jgi:hypothetical protein